VQVLQLLTVTFLVLGYGAEQFIYEYLLVFLVSVVLSIISFAGIGVREYVFYQSAQWLHFDQQVSVTIGLLFTCLTAIISLGGIWYVFKKTPLEKEKIASDN
jgi:branched-subunit amino acid ABC-type transport system permease component